jgi:4-hydroxybenzoate polyprenyltransferase
MDFKKFTGLIMIEQTLFALPFAYIGMLFAGGGKPSDWLWATLALIAARTAGMSFNRILDADIDAKNPRTSNRHIPSGELSKKSVWVLSALTSALLVFSSFMLNSLVFYLSFAALLLLFTYSFIKRFSSSSHFYLGVVEAAAPIGGYLAVSGKFESAAFLPGAAILFWIAALDILYSIQDMEFDKKEGLFSIPSKYGLNTALIISALSYILAAASLVVSGILINGGRIYYVFAAAAFLLFCAQFYLANKNKENINEAIFKVFFINRFISPVILAGVLIDFIFRKYNFY